tara:strand:+ start:276 stop:791 length:516 start_codon:yes stop_codon:yes gene_type:complete
MDQLLLFITVLVAFSYFGGSNVPKVLRDNKQVILGLVGGLVLCSFMCKNVEGFNSVSDELSDEVVNVLERQCNYYLVDKGLTSYCNSANTLQFAPKNIYGLSQEQITELYVPSKKFTDCEYCRNNPNSECVDRYTTDTCNEYITSGTLSCDDFAQPAYRGCDFTCGYCGDE